MSFALIIGVKIKLAVDFKELFFSVYVLRKFNHKLFYYYIFLKNIGSHKILLKVIHHVRPFLECMWTQYGPLTVVWTILSCSMAQQILTMR